jgi:diamine N-acetyltransferase
MEPSFRIAAESDADLMLPMMCEYYAFDHHPFDLEQARGALKGLLREPGLGRVWLVCAGKTVVGYIVLTFGYSLELLGRDAFVDEFFLLESYRGQGWGRKTMQFVEQAALSSRFTLFTWKSPGIIQAPSASTRSLDLWTADIT